MNEHGRSVEKPAVRALPARADRERMLGRVLEAAAERARIWYEADDASDVAQDVGFKFWEAWKADPGMFDAGEVPIYWIGVAVRNAVIDRKRAAKTREFAEVPADQVRDEAVESGVDPAAQAESFELGRHLAEALNALTAKQRAVWFRVHDHDETYAEAAKAMGLTTETVKAYRARAMQIVRNAFVGYEGSPDNE